MYDLVSLQLSVVTGSRAIAIGLAAKHRHRHLPETGGRGDLVRSSKSRRHVTADLEVVFRVAFPTRTASASWRSSALILLPSRQSPLGVRCPQPGAGGRRSSCSSWNGQPFSCGFSITVLPSKRVHDIMDLRGRRVRDHGECNGGVRTQGHRVWLHFSASSLPLVQAAPPFNCNVVFICSSTALSSRDNCLPLTSSPSGHPVDPHARASPGPGTKGHASLMKLETCAIMPRRCPFALPKPVRSIGAATLLRFYRAHCMVIPLAADS